MGADDELLMLGPGEWLRTRRVSLDRGEGRWLEVLATFDLNQEWAFDGQLSCVDWLMWRTGMSRSTAFEKVRTAHELRRRPLIASALDAGQISYSAVRVITRLDNPDPEVDAALLDLAIAGTVRDLEHAVRHYQLLAEQERSPGAARLERRGMRVSRGFDGFGLAEIVLDDVELEELEVTVQAFMDHASQGERERRKPVDKSTCGDFAEAPPEVVPARQRRADAFMDLVRTALANLGGRHASGGDRYMTNIVIDAATGQAQRLDGTPLRASDAARVTCDASVTTHIRGEGEPLNLGRRTRTWNQAQRRAIAVRDHGTCRFPGCTRTICDVHHLHWWSNGGPTDLANGLLLCSRHHTLVHEGYAAAGDANGAVTFQRPDGTGVGSSSPPRRHWGVMASAS